MLRLPPGSTWWLLAHELRLAWRGSRATSNVRGRIRLILFVVVLGALCFMAGLPLALWARHMPANPPPELLLALDAGLLVIWTLMLSQTLSASAMALYERGDLDLLLSSPISARKVLAVRGVGIAVMAMVWFAAFATAFVLPAAVVASPRWLAVYLVLISLALLAASAGLLLAMALFAVLGARRTRTVAQVMAAIIGALFFLVSQARSFMSNRTAAAGQAALEWVRHAAHSPWFSPGSPLTWPARALLGDPLPALGITLASVAVFAAVAGSLGRRFAADAAAAAGAGAGGRKRVHRRVRAFASGPFRAVLRKEMLLLLRDPALMSQVLLRVLYVLPLTFVVIKNASRHADLAVAGGAAALTVMSGQLAGSLAWIAISAEDSPDLIACAPVARSLLNQAKLTSAVLPVALMLVIPCAILGWFAPLAGLAAFAGAVVSAASSAVINLWYQKPGKRQAFKGRQRASLLAGLAEFAVSLLWAASTGMLAAGTIWFVAPAVVAVIFLIILRRRDPAGSPASPRVTQVNARTAARV